MIRKLRSRRGETLVEVLASLLVAVMIISMLPMAVETAARINARVKDMETICAHTMDGTEADAQVTISNSIGTTLQELTVQGYSEDGFVYYTGITETE